VPGYDEGVSKYGRVRVGTDEAEYKMKQLKLTSAVGKKEPRS